METVILECTQCLILHLPPFEGNLAKFGAFQKFGIVCKKSPKALAINFFFDGMKWSILSQIIGNELRSRK